jgi:hypothetical protein
MKPINDWIDHVIGGFVPIAVVVTPPMIYALIRVVSEAGELIIKGLSDSKRELESIRKAIEKLSDR